jgi:hypothetical protein
MNSNYGYQQTLEKRLPHTHVLCFIMGWQGGTVHQVASALGVEVNDILDASQERMGELARMAQVVYWKEHKGEVNMLLLKHLSRTLAYLEAHFDGIERPEWINRAEGVRKICAEFVGLPSTKVGKTG